MEVPKSLMRKKEVKRTGKLWQNKVRLIAVRKQDVS